MKQQEHPGDDPNPNIILRRGKFAGFKLSGNPSQALAIGSGGSDYFVYRPTGRQDDEFPALTRFEPDIDMS